jgi:class 3 adenylate cyclase/CHASE2 domain-containing sensor protein
MDAHPPGTRRSVVEMLRVIPRALVGVHHALARFPFRSRLAVLGLATTLAVMLADSMGWLDPLERSLYDVRARRCQVARPATVPFVHVDIDDTSLEVVARWPWPRRVLAAAVDELVAGGARRVALDLLLNERSRQEDWVMAAASTASNSPTTRPVTRPATGQHAADGDGDEPGDERDEDDSLLAAAMARAGGKVFLPVTYSWAFPGSEDEMTADVRRILRESPAMAPEGVRERLLKRWPGREAAVDGLLRESLVKIRRQVFLDVMLTPPRLPAGLHRETLVQRGRAPSTAPAVRHPLERFFARQFDKSESIWALWDTFPCKADRLGVDLLHTATEDGPLHAFAAHAGGYGFADYIADDDGVVRSVPLVVKHRDSVAPQLALALACADLGVRPDVEGELEIGPDRIVLRPPGGAARVIPVFTATQRGGRVKVPGSFLIPWHGDRDWEAMFRETASGAAIRHLPFTAVSKIIEVRYERDENRRRSLADLNLLRQRKKLPTVAAAGPDYESRIEETLRQWSFTINSMRKNQGQLPNMAPADAADLRAALARVARLEKVLADNRKHAADLDAWADELRGAVSGRVVILGWAATGAAADFVPTPIHDRCPGAVIHGAVYNAILTGGGMRLAPRWVTPLLTLVLGCLAVWVMVQAAPLDDTGRGGGMRGRADEGWRAALRRLVRLKLSPTQATLFGFALVFAWVLCNSIVLFQWNRYVVGIAAPVTALLSVWSLGIGALAAERFRITRMLHGYLDPKLIDYLKKHPEDELFRTREQEVTVCFSDVQGFTTLTQELGERMIPLLQEYLSRMVAVIRRHGGVVDKFMGDGIMFIFGVPERDGTNHAEAALRCCLGMQAALTEFNAQRVPGQFPALRMRCGVNTGMAFVGDAGPLEAREYTALGDTVNVASRLEPVNKEFGTRILVSESTRRKLPGDAFFLRPVGRLKLRNRTGCVEAFELVGPLSDATPDELELARLVQGMVLAFQQRMPRECRMYADRICERWPGSPLCAVYRRRCDELGSRDWGDEFEGEAVRQ